MTTGYDFDPAKPHYHVMCGEDLEIRTFRTAPEARLYMQNLRRIQGLAAFVETCGKQCPVLFDRPFDTKGSRKELR